MVFVASIKSGRLLILCLSETNDHTMKANIETGFCSSKKKPVSIIAVMIGSYVYDKHSLVVFKV